MRLHKITNNGMKIYSTPTDFVVKMGDTVVARFDDPQAAYAYCDDSTVLTTDTDEGKIILKPRNGVL